MMRRRGLWITLGVMAGIVAIHACQWAGSYRAISPVATIETTKLPMMVMWVQRGNCDDRALRITDGRACTWLYPDRGQIGSVYMPCRKDGYC